MLIRPFMVYMLLEDARYTLKYNKIAYKLMFFFSLFFGKYVVNRKCQEEGKTPYKRNNKEIEVNTLQN